MTFYALVDVPLEPPEKQQAFLLKDDKPYSEDGGSKKLGLSK